MTTTPRVRLTADRSPPALVRDFITNALAHDAVADKVAELLYTYLAHDDRDPTRSHARSAT